MGTRKLEQVQKKSLTRLPLSLKEGSTHIRTIVVAGEKKMPEASEVVFCFLLLSDLVSLQVLVSIKKMFDASTYIELNSQHR